MVRRFDIWLVSLDPAQGHEIRKTRPCVVISPDEIHVYLKTVIIAPMTSGSFDAPSRVGIFFDGKEGKIVLDQIRTIDRRGIPSIGRSGWKKWRRAVPSNTPNTRRMPERTDRSARITRHSVRTQGSRPIRRRATRTRKNGPAAGSMRAAAGAIENDGMEETVPLEGQKPGREGGRSFPLPVVYVMSMCASGCLRH